MVIKFAYPGITGKQLQNQFKSEFLPAPEHIGIIILHVGTNNASTFKQNQPVWDAVNECKPTKMGRESRSSSGY